MTDKEKEIKELKSALSDAIRSFTRLETLYKVRRNELEIANDKIAGLTGKCEALQKDNENLTRTLEESREGEKQKTRENELHEPKISEKYFYVTMLNCQQCGEFLAKDERVADIPIDIRIKECKRKIPNYCPNCGARLKEVSE